MSLINQKCLRTFAAAFKKHATRQTLSAGIDRPTCRFISNGEESKLVAMPILKHIKADLKRADVNRDGRLDFEELQLLLSKYNSFTETQIQQMGDLFFVGKSGQSVSHTTFLRAVLYKIQQQEESSPSLDNVNDSNPLRLENLEDRRCWITRADDKSAIFYNTQQEFDRLLLKYIEECKRQVEV